MFEEFLNPNRWVKPRLQKSTREKSFLKIPDLPRVWEMHSDQHSHSKYAIIGNADF